MYNLCGTHSRKIDSKSRIGIPQPIRMQIEKIDGEKPFLYIRRVDDLNLAIIYPERTYENIQEPYLNMPDGSNERICFFTSFINSIMQWDKEG